MVLVKFIDLESESVHYGFRINDIVYCGCCGGSFDMTEENPGIEILDSYDGPIEDIIQGAM